MFWLLAKTDQLYKKEFAFLEKFFPFSADPISKGAWFTERPRRSHKSCLPMKVVSLWKELQKKYQGYPVTGCNSHYCWNTLNENDLKYSKIPILRPPLRLSKRGLKDHFWTVPKVVCNQIYTECRKWSKE